MISGLARVSEDWLADPDNRKRRDDLRKCVREATPEQLLEMSNDVQALALDVRRWQDEIPAGRLLDDF